MKSEFFDYTPDLQLLSPEKRVWWEKSRCATCQNPLQQRWINIPRHLAGEWIKKGLLGGEAEAVFHSTRDDLGWSVQAYICENCKKIQPEHLTHRG